MTLPLAASSWARLRGTIGHKGPLQAPRDRIGRGRGGGRRREMVGSSPPPLLSLAPTSTPAESKMGFTLAVGWAGGRSSSMAVSPRLGQVVRASRWLTADHSVVTSGLHDEAVTDASAH